MTAASVLALCVSRGLRLVPSGEGVHVAGPKAIRDELRETIREHKTELVSLLRAGREAEVKAFYSQAFGRLGALYPDSLLGNLWPSIVAQHPALARGIDVAEQAADSAALDYQTGTAADSSAFLSCLQTWETAWTQAIEAVTHTSRACDDCGRTDATIMVETDTGRFCRRCLRPEPLAVKPKTKGCDA